MATGIIFDPLYLEHKTGIHVESPERLTAIMSLIEKEKMLEGPFSLVEPAMASIEDVKLVHEASMIDRVQKMSLKATDTRLQILDFGDTVVSKKTFDVSLLAAGGAMKAVDLVMDGTLENAFAVVRPPGHHANKQRSSGFCIFNNIAIMAEHALRQDGIEKVAIFDIDLHHGNGTSDIFYDRDDVLFFSSHQDGRTQYPGSGFIHEIGEDAGEGYTVNLPLTVDASDDVVQTAFNEVIGPIFDQYAPDIILGSIGCDAHHSDPLSGLSFTTQGYGEYVRRFNELAKKHCGGKMVLTLEGGYKVNILAKCVVNILNVMAGKEIPFLEDRIFSKRNVVEYHDALNERLKEILGDFWKF